MVTKAPRTRPWTRADLARLPDDGNRYEVLDGQLLVTPQASFPHQYAASELIAALGVYCRQHALGVVVGPGAVPFGKNELEPDVEVVPVAPRDITDTWDDAPRPILVIEVLSQGTRRRDHGIKREAYLRLGIPEYWVIDRFDHCAFIWKTGATEPLVVTGAIVWTPRADLPSFEIALDTILPSGRPSAEAD